MGRFWPCAKQRVLSVSNFIILVPEVFLDFFIVILESCERVAKRWTRVAKRRERKTSGYLGLESRFHADVRVRIWPSSSDWLIFLHTHTQINTIGSFDWQYRGDGGDICHCTSCVYISTREKICLQNTAVLSLYHVNVQDSSVFYIDFVSDSAFEGIWPLYSRSVFTDLLKVSTNTKALLAAINQSQRCVAHSANRT